MNTQNAAILAHLEAGKPITPLQALERFNCLRLSARIYDLRCAGYPIESRRITRNGKSFAQYRMVKS